MTRIELTFRLIVSSMGVLDVLAILTVAIVLPLSVRKRATFELT
jgi:hypothetical protein